MSVPGTIPIYDASNSHLFEEGVEKDFAAGKRTFFNEQMGLVIAFSALFVFLVYVLLTSDYPLWQVLALIIFLSALEVAMVVITVHTFRRPLIHPVQITPDGTLFLGPGRWELRSVATVEISGGYFTFRGQDGKRLLVVRDYQVGDQKGFIAAVARVAPGIDFREDSEPMPPHLVRMIKT